MALKKLLPKSLDEKIHKLEDKNPERYKVFPGFYL